MSLNYTDKVQWENLWDDITLSARGLVVDDLGNVVARPFKKFFNLSEGKTKLSPYFEIQEKLDGSLGILFYYENQWVFASRGSFNSEQSIKGKEILDRYCNYDLLDRNNTYCFEIIYPENRIVVQYNGLEKCILTAVFDTETGVEQSIKIWGLPYAKTFLINSHISELHKYINKDEEGYVIKFSNGERCKIKGEEYLRLHKMMSEMSTTVVWECLRKGDAITDVLKDVPDEFFKTIREYQESLINEFNNKKIHIENEFKTINFSLGVCDDKTFAKFVKGNEYEHFLFKLRKKIDITDMVWKSIKPRFRKL